MRVLTALVVALSMEACTPLPIQPIPSPAPTLDIRIREHYEGGEELKYRCVKKRQDLYQKGQIVRSKIEIEEGDYCRNPSRSFILLLEYDEKGREIMRNASDINGQEVTAITYHPNGNVKQISKITYEEDKPYHFHIDLYTSEGKNLKRLDSGEINTQGTLISGSIDTFIDNVPHTDWIRDGRLNADDSDINNPDTDYTINTPLVPEINFKRND